MLSLAGVGYMFADYRGNILYLAVGIALYQCNRSKEMESLRQTSQSWNGTMGRKALEMVIRIFGPHSWTKKTAECSTHLFSVTRQRQIASRDYVSLSFESKKTEMDGIHLRAVVFSALKITKAVSNDRQRLRLKGQHVQTFSLGNRAFSQGFRLDSMYPFHIRTISRINIGRDEKLHHQTHLFEPNSVVM
jgi:hypothetical protein